MSHALVESLQLTILGMGMTFLSIGALVAGMFLLTRLTAVRAGGRTDAAFPEGGERPAAEPALAEEDVLNTTRAEAQVLPQEDVSFLGDDGAAESRRRAAAAAVAVALALEAQPASMPEAAAHPSALDAWNTYARSLHLSGRARYESLRGRR